jgi:hypothetical protein
MHIVAPTIELFNIINVLYDVLLTSSIYNSLNVGVIQSRSIYNYVVIYSSMTSAVSQNTSNGSMTAAGCKHH